VYLWLQRHPTALDAGVVALLLLTGATPQRPQKHTTTPSEPDSSSRAACLTGHRAPTTA
jgi:hypothetical protein